MGYEEHIKLAEELGLPKQVAAAQSMIKTDIAKQTGCKKVTRKDVNDMLGITYYNSSRLMKMPKVWRFLFPVLYFLGLSAIFWGLKCFCPSLTKEEGAEYIIPGIVGLAGLIIFPVLVLGEDNHAYFNTRDLQEASFSIPFDILIRVKETRRFFDSLIYAMSDINDRYVILGQINNDGYYLLYCGEKGCEIDQGPPILPQIEENEKLILKSDRYQLLKREV